MDEPLLNGAVLPTDGGDSAKLSIIFSDVRLELRPKMKGHSGLLAGRCGSDVDEYPFLRDGRTLAGNLRLNNHSQQLSPPWKAH